MKVAVAGGTGTVGRHVVDEARRRSHEVVVLSRSTGVDLTTGAGLNAALAGVDVVIDVSNRNGIRRGPAVAFFTAVTRSLLKAEQAAGVGHHIALSIVGIDGSALGYYQGKVAQEQQIRAGAVPFTILRATQFHEFADQALARRWGPFAVLPHMQTEPVAAREVAEKLVDLAEGPPRQGTVELAGPEVLDVVDMARRVVEHRRRRLFVIPVMMPGAAGKAVRTGALLADSGAERGRQTFGQWLSEQSPSPH